MLPLFGGYNASASRRRAMDLGGTRVSQDTQSSLLEAARIRRQEREASRRQEDAALLVQATWRGWKTRRGARYATKHVFERDLREGGGGVEGVRWLVVMGGSEEDVGRWCEVWKESDMQASEWRDIGKDRSDWLMKRICTRVLDSVAENPTSQYALAHLDVLSKLFVDPRILEHALHHGLYAQLSRAIARIPPESKSHPVLPPLISLACKILTLSKTSQTQVAFLVNLLSIPLLPYRIPLPSLSQISGSLPFEALPGINEHLPSLGLERQVHMIANLYTFANPRYPAKGKPGMGRANFDHCVQGMSAILSVLPIGVLGGPTAKTSRPSPLDVDLDSDDGAVNSPSNPPGSSIVESLPPRTIRTLAVISSTTHLYALLSMPSPRTLPLITLLCTIIIHVPSSLGAIVAHPTGGPLIRETWRTSIRPSAFGREATAAVYEAGAEDWAPLLLAADVYSQTLMTMTDDEFFGSRSGATSSSASAVGNPLSLDEAIDFSKRLLNVAFSLFWYTQPPTTTHIPAFPSLSLQSARSRVVRCLLAINVRDARRPFVPKGHWLVGTLTEKEADMVGFMEAAVLEETRAVEEAEKEDEENAYEDGDSMEADTDQRASNRARRQIGARKAQELRKMAYLTPRLRVLRHIPFAIPFAARVAIFRAFIGGDMHRHYHASYEPSFSGSAPINPLARMAQMFGGRRGGRAHAAATVRRGHVAEDGFSKLGGDAEPGSSSYVDLKSTLQITFIDQWGNEEAGIDGGGVFKEFLTDLVREVFDVNRGLWVENERRELYPAVGEYARDRHSLNWYRFIGRILGKAIYEGILVDVAFAGFFLAKWLGRQSYLDDLESLDPELYRGLVYLKNFEGNFEDLALNFTIAVQEFGVTNTIDLKSLGSTIPVTRSNRLEYIHLVAHYRLNTQIRHQANAFFQGLSEMIDPRWLKMFNQQEVQVLLGGADTPVDVDDLKKNTVYSGVYDPEEETIRAFWEVVEGLGHGERRALLRFVTSCSRPPLLGFKELVPQFAIRDAGNDEHRLPTSSTCVNLLKLPRYKSTKVLREKLLQAIHSGAGFDLS